MSLGIFDTKGRGQNEFSKIHSVHFHDVFCNFIKFYNIFSCKSEDHKTCPDEIPLNPCTIPIFNK